MSLLFDRDYVSFLSKTHPDLKICHERFTIPSYIASLDISEPVLSPMLKHIIRYAGAFKLSLAKPKALFLGLPFEPYEQTEILSQIKNLKNSIQEFSAFASMKKLDLIVLTNVSKTHLDFNRWIQAGFYSLPSFPDMTVQINSDSFEQHLKTISLNARKSIKKNICIFKRAGFYLEQTNNTKMAAHTLYQAYRVFYDRAKIRWYAHTAHYFAYLAQLDQKVRITLAKTQADEIVGFIVNFIDTNSLQAARIGVIPDQYRKNAIYFRLLYSALEDAIRIGAKTLSLEPTAFRAKRRFGATYRPLVNLIYGTSPTWRILSTTCMGLAKKALSHLDNIDILEANY